jgi:hypothetical protein
LPTLNQNSGSVTDGEGHFRSHDQRISLHLKGIWILSS